MKRIALIVWTCLASTWLIGQPYGNEWIDYDNNYRYYAFPVYEDGIHRIPFQTFADANISLDSEELDKVKVFAFGKQIPLFVERGLNGSFSDPEDYIEFIGEGNDGRMDVRLYENPDWHANKDYSMFNDTIRYYLAIPTNDDQEEGLRFQETDQSNIGNYDAQPYVWHTSKRVYSSHYHIQPLLLDDPLPSDPNFRVALSTFEPGEGWASSAFGLGNPVRNESVPTPFIYTDNQSLQTRIEADIIGVSDREEETDHQIQLYIGDQLLANHQYEGYKVMRYSFLQNIDVLEEGSTIIRLEIPNNLGLPVDNQAYSRIEIEYPRLTDLSVNDPSQSFSFNYRFNNNSSFTRFDFTGVQGANPRIYTTGNPQRIELNQQGSTYPALIQNWNTGEDFTCHIVSDEALVVVNEFKRVTPSGFFTDFDELQQDSAFVIITHRLFTQVANQYKSYREFGSNYRNRNFKTVIVYVDDLFDQFAYGVPKSGMALHNFARYMLEQWDTDPQYLLLMGNSVRTATRNRQQDNSNLAGYRKQPALYASNLVPSVGYPMSDNLISSENFGSKLYPKIRTGRISVFTPTQAEAYLNKVVEFENQPPALWMKNFMHFGGGRFDAEQAQFANFLAFYESYAADSSFGADVHSFLKTSSDPIEINVSEEINQLIEDEGVSMMTFFAHAGGSAGFDQSIDDPSNFNWNGKYPFLLGNGCYTADIHSANNNSTSEEYTLLPNKGVIGFLASSDVGLVGDLHLFSLTYYRYLSLDNYGESVGDHIKKSLSEIETLFTNDTGYTSVLKRYLCHGMTLQGDPSVILNSWDKPDFDISDTDIFFTPEEITAELDSFQVNVVVSNIGQATNMPFLITLEHNTPNGIGDSTYFATMQGLNYLDTVSFNVPVDLLNGLGLHNFDVLVDRPVSQIEELDDSTNNEASAELFLASSGIVPILPKKYAVIPEPNVTLKASTGNALAELRTYRLEIDTTDTFDSPALQTTEISQTGGVVEWQPKLNYPDSIVYFWRCAEIKDEISWRNSSFQYIPDKKGWGQDHIFQFEGNSLSLVDINRNEREFEFRTGDVTITNNVYGGSPGSIANNVVVNIEEVEYASCPPLKSIYMVVLDPVTFEAWGTNFGGANPENDFGNSFCRQRVEFFFPFHQTNPAQLEALADLLQSDILDGYYVVLYTIGNVDYNLWEATNGEIFNAFQSLGNTQVGATDATNNVPFSIILRKGSPETLSEMYGINPTDYLQHVANVKASLGEGKIRTPVLGPALSWENASWKLTTLDELEGDESIIRLIGIDEQGVEVPVPGGEFSLNFPGGENDIDLGSLVNADQYPELRLESDLKDFAYTTPLQIGRWHVLHEDVPEAAVDPNTYFEFKAETIQQGDEGFISVAIRNISDVDMDSLLVHYWIEDENRNRIDIPYPRQAPLLAQGTLIDTVYFDTRYLTGRNVLRVEVNPKGPDGVYDQLEQDHFNNLLQISFDVIVDNENPILDVTFDGIHIINGEIVSPRPEIVVALKDENPFLIMDEPSDTSLFKLFLASPGSIEKRLYFNPSGTEEPYMEFIPAVNQKNRAKVFLNPQLVQDGTYRLIVQAQDKSGNSSSNVQYSIEFEVIQQSTITEVLNYPNPFSTSTQFVFTLTGSQIPDEFKIQIMTISGRVVREITQDEIGPIRIGRNITNYRWDGHDEFGDRLANGVYLYRVFARINGEDITTRDGGAGQHFKESFGKMVLFR